MSLRRLSGLALVLLPIGIFGVTFAFARAQGTKATAARATPAADVSTRAKAVEPARVQLGPGGPDNILQCNIGEGKRLRAALKS